MNARKFTKLFFILTTLIFIIIEIIFQLNKCQHKSKIDYIINHKLNNMKNKSYDSLILGDSISTMVLSPTIIKNNILDLSTTVPVSLVGNYFAIKRYLENNNEVESIYLFTSVELLNETLNRNLTYSYFESIFTRRNEIKEVTKIRPDLYKNTFLDNYFISRKNKLTLSKCLVHKIKQKPTYINETDLIKKSDFTNRAINDKIIKYKEYNTIPELPKIYLDKIIELSNSNNIKFTLIIEPSLEDANKLFLKSKWKRYLDKLPITIININNYYQFNNYAFKSDGLHLRGDNNLYYQNLINRHILKLYKEEK